MADYFSEMDVGEPVMELTLATPSRQVHWLTPEELASSHLATIRVEGVSPVVESEGANGLGGDPIDAQSGAVSVLVAKSAAALLAGPGKIESAFSYRRGGGSVLATFQPRDGGRVASRRPAADLLSQRRANARRSVPGRGRRQAAR